MSDVVEALIRGGSPVDLPDWNGVTPLAAAFAYHSSSCHDHREVYRADVRQTSYQLQGDDIRWLPERDDHGSEDSENEGKNSESSGVSESLGSEGPSALESLEEGSESGHS